MSCAEDVSMFSFKLAFMANGPLLTRSEGVNTIQRLTVIEIWQTQQQARRLDLENQFV